MAKAKSAATAIAVQNKATKDMSPELVKEFDIIAQKLNELDQKDVMNRYDIGVHISKVKEGDAKYGEGAVEKIAAAMNRQADELYAVARIAETWSREELESILERGAKAKFQITYSHATPVTPHETVAVNTTES